MQQGLGIITECKNDFKLHHLKKYHNIFKSYNVFEAPSCKVHLNRLVFILTIRPVSRDV